MQKLSLISGFILLVFYSLAQQNPHGNSLTIACTDCHTTEGWTFTKEKANFDHNKTSFVLEGQHTVTDCKACHQTLVFNEAKSNCIDCHTDMHNNTVGPNCNECHTPKSWIVENITEIHQNSRFPLLGAHNTASCSDCHASASKLEFQPLGVDCYDCHRPDYEATTNPNHIQTGLSTNCVECHRIDAFSWSGAGINHDFFPLTRGHEINDCAACHKGDLMQPISSECVSCHQADYNSTSNPDHQNLGFSTSCTECHTTNPDWKPAEFKEHDALYFPIYSGSHNGEWNRCTDCHTQAGSYNSFSCTDCHEHNKTDMDRKHREENGYVYSSPACFACHPTGRGEGSFNHSATGFPLKGGHLQANCLDCHSNGYAGTPTQCASCHTDNYNKSQNPNHVAAGISTECETCHTEDGWQPSLFDHNATGFELTGGHFGKQCSACHIGNTTSATSDCFSCHEANYNSAENHLAQNYPHDCTQCHSTNNWDDANFNHDATAFPLKGAHVATACAECHTEGYAGTPTQCASCHTDNYNNAVNPNHKAAGISSECETCHTESGWIPSQFDHTATTGFALTGGHSGKQCSACHIGNTTSATSDCFSCHEANYNSAENHLAQNYPHDCAQCHSTNTWDDANFNHDATAFPLKGAHVATACAECHTEGYAGTPTQCASCHTENYNNAVNPNHKAAGISSECETCHTESGWTPSQFDHAATTGFALTGGHSVKQCSACHIGNTTSATSDCFSCHEANYNSAENHLAQNYPHDCTQCHSTNNWDDANFNHDATAFPLKGAHVATACAECHTEGYAGTPTQCASCHTDNYNKSQNPNHVAAGISTECETCHTESGWIPSQFDHTATTGFALTGGHSGKQCSACHIGNTTSATSDCFSCHEANYNSAENHLAQNYPHDCTQCHSTNNWDDANFNHDATAFPLKGAHVATACAECHTEGYAGTPTQCASCHTDNYNNAVNPNHKAAGISSECETCHTESGWVPSQFDHTATTGFALTGGHSGKQCSACHIGNTTSATSDCFSCHESNYNSVDNHLAQNYPHDCTQCHSTNSWGGATFDHNQTNFPLTGAHVATECSACHADGYAGTSMLCASCHQSNYNNAANPNHSSLGFSTSCDECHTTTPGWQPALMPNHNDYYALNGAHATVADNCYLCHAGNYTSTPNTCYACHTSDYNNTTDPNHSAAQFSTDCATCHSENAWKPSTFNHDAQYFPIYSGKHREAWSSCTECHTNPSNYAVFSCLTCHEHNQTSMNEKHHEVNGYVYASASCLACHPTGRAD